ncbi:flavodoxin family protein [Levilactobacillus angrenensis]|uniref:Flavodoxin family protein n=1 Tax=Levilactobacillus angrenensis TaxID=2486020 RepID=A0ABW1U8X0_9LACO|nr:NAD(P)H-dependent oxidoreductase [Levilactobacillus angrenensis]
MTILLINGSPRKHGNTATLGERFLHDYPHTTIHLADHPLHFVQDHRDTALPQRDTTDDYEQLMTTFAQADDIVLGTPVYWYGMTGQLKVFMDRWFDSYTNDFDFAGKRVYLLVVGADAPQTKALGITQAVQHSCEWLKMTFQGTATVTADGPGDVAAMTDLPGSYWQLAAKLHAQV